MNREPNKEIEILLRKLSRKQNGNFAAAEGNSSASGYEHLDADELNAYAENALPASLRLRYTEHLADCSSCRQIVTQLSLSSTAATAHAAAEERTPSRLKTFLAALFSPLLLRYAVPAMAVVLVVALAWIVVRRESVVDQLAQNGETRTIAPVQPNPGAAAPVPSDSGLIPEAQPAPPPARKEATSQATPSADRAASTSAGN
ncbi:MAG TPA: zf-HC2 domain-containing protein, partial [Pyrinomonadaceae bacterium]|nr:zf-HC2 domain-containing protein [Pyrinomonadaceae bacterium]